MIVRVVIVLPLLFIAGCGATPSSTRSDAPSSAAPIPATSQIARVPGTDGPEATLAAVTSFLTGTVVPDSSALPVPVMVTEPCPESVSLSSNGDPSAMMSESSRLEPMLGVVLAYGGEHPDEFGTYGLIWQGDGDASVFTSFTGHLEQHRAALAGVVEFPDELIVCQSALTGDAARALIRSLTQELGGRFMSVGQGTGPIEVVLKETEEALAAELAARYGDAVRLRVGLLPYPISTATSVCSEPIGADPPPGLDVAIDPPAAPLTRNGLAQPAFEIRLTNVGEAPVQFATGAARGTILDLDGTVVGSSANIGSDDVGIMIDLAPGASSTMPGLVGLASCDPRLGYALPPGEYQLVATLSAVDAASTPIEILTPPQRIVVA